MPSLNFTKGPDNPTPVVGVLLANSREAVWPYEKLVLGWRGVRLGGLQQLAKLQNEELRSGMASQVFRLHLSARQYVTQASVP